MVTAVPLTGDSSTHYAWHVILEHVTSNDQLVAHHSGTTAPTETLIISLFHITTLWLGLRLGPAQLTSEFTLVSVRVLTGLAAWAQGSLRAAPFLWWLWRKAGDSICGRVSPRADPIPWALLPTWGSGAWPSLCLVVLQLASMELRC